MQFLPNIKRGLTAILLVALLATAVVQMGFAPQPNKLPPMLTKNTQGLNPELLRRFDAFRTFIYQNYGVVIEIRSGYRSTAEQAYLYATLPRGRANPPGRSNHEKGEAIDYTNFSPVFNQHLYKFGLKLPFSGKENWHIERADL